MLQQQGQEAIQVTAPELVICPGGAPHHMSHGDMSEIVTFEDILNGIKPGPVLLRSGQSAETTSLLCGAFLLRAAPLNPLLASLPSVLKLDTGDSSGSPLLREAANLLRLEVGRGNRSSFSACRLLELVFAEVLLAFGRLKGSETAGWFKALDDHRIGPALAKIHQHPEGDISVPDLAACCSMSPSRFAARFRGAMGCSVMAYVTRWRMNLACELLRSSGRGLAEIAAQVGYTDVAAFSRSFKHLVGQSPAYWRNAVALKTAA